jgi:transcriptional regulator with XRE-family HTH domain
MTAAAVTDRPASRHTPIGEAGQNVIANVERLRQARNLSFRGLSERLGALGRPILPAVLHRLSQGRRRVDADDLVAFAAALGVTPADLLLPPDAASDPADKDHPALREARELVTRIEGTLSASCDTGQREHVARSLKRSLKRVRFEVAELLEEPSGPAEGS